MPFKELIKHGGEQSSNDNGFTIIEVLIAMAIFAIGILAVATMQISSINGNAGARKYSEASSFAQGQIESLMSISFANIVNSNSVNADGYRVQTTILNQSDLDLDGDNDIMNVEVTVFDPSGIERSRVTFLKAADI